MCVIGAGMSGLITMKELLDENQAVVCYEQQGAEGGVFNLDDRVGNTAYDSTLLTVSNYAMAFSCFPPAEHEERRFWTVKEYQHYLARFVDHFHLRGFIQFNATVRSVRRFKDSLWLVTVETGGELREEVFDAVAVCTGAFQRPKLPELPFVGGNDGAVEVLHSIDYDRPDRFRGKRVLCLGMGESGADIVHEIATVADAAMLSVRPSPPPLIPRYDCEHLGAIPNDGETTAHRYGAFLNQFRSRFNRTRDLTAWELARDRELAALDDTADTNSGALEGRPANEEHRYQRIARFIAAWNRRSYAGGLPFVSRFLTKNTAFVQDAAEGRLEVEFSGLERIEGGLCVFRDGRTFEADTIMCCTGYEERLSALFQEDDFLRQHLGGTLNPRAWFKHAIHPKVGRRLAFVGFARPTQGMLPACSELQARYFALLCSGRRVLPQDLEARTRAENAAEEEMLKGDRNIKSLVQYPYFSEGMAELIGCKPSLRTRLLDPVLGYKLFFGSKVSFRFRLDGPHRDRRAAKRVIKKLRVADTVRGQLTTGLLNLRPVYEAWALVSTVVDAVVPPERRGAKDRALHAWGPGQLRQQPPPQEPRAQGPTARRATRDPGRPQRRTHSAQRR